MSSDNDSTGHDVAGIDVEVPRRAYGDSGMPETLLNYLESARSVAISIVTNRDWMLVIFTGLLAIFTGRLWYTTKKDTRILQRAYIAVEPLGVHLMPNGSDITGHVRMKNAGRLPARKVNWFINIDCSESGQERESLFPLRRGSGNIVIAPGTVATHGTGNSVQVQKLNEFSGTDAGGERSTYFYVWGAVRYDDGFKKTRTTKFCHRYSWDTRKEGDKRYEIDAANARYHDYGNGAD